MTPEVRRTLGAERAMVAHLINHEMRRRGFSQVSLGKELGISGEAVSRVVNGHGHSAQVLDKLREIGVPEAYLHDPRRAALPSAGGRRTQHKEVA